MMILAGCAGSGEGGGLAATLVSPTEISLGWRGLEPDVAGRVVEFATGPGGPWTILEFVAPGESRFTHAELMPRTPFYYRVRDYLGPVSGVVEVTLPEGPGVPADDDHDWAVPRVLAGGVGASASIRGGGGGPTGFGGVVKHANGIWFTWVDHAGDEEGYLLEARADGRADFRVVAVVEANVNSFGLITMPGEKRASYRVRAFYYGGQSNVVRRTTGG